MFFFDMYPDDDDGASTLHRCPTGCDRAERAEAPRGEGAGDVDVYRDGHGCRGCVYPGVALYHLPPLFLLFLRHLTSCIMEREDVCVLKKAHDAFYKSRGKACGGGLLKMERGYGI